MGIFDLNGKFIRNLRDELKWSREELSEKSGVPERTIQDIESDKSANPGIDTYKKLLKALPNYIDPTMEKIDLLLAIYNISTALNEKELRAVLSMIKAMPSLRGEVSTSDAG